VTFLAPPWACLRPPESRGVSLRSSRLRRAMDPACTCDVPRVYLAGERGVAAAAAKRSWHQRDTRPHVSSEPSTCAFSSDVTLSITIGRGYASAMLAAAEVNFRDRRPSRLASAWRRHLGGEAHALGLELADSDRDGWTASGLDGIDALRAVTRSATGQKRRK
jgi:hypothetical protein